MIRKHRPWKKSTGPKTKEGKEKSSLNALKMSRQEKDNKQEMAQIRKILQSQLQFMEEYNEYKNMLKERRTCTKNELIKKQ